MNTNPPECKSTRGLAHFRTFLVDRAYLSAVAERSGDTAFGRASGVQIIPTLRACKSGVALDFPPQSKICGFRSSRVGTVLFQLF
jgi:hypothetical protein